MKLNLTFFIAITTFLMIIGCNQEISDFETVEGIEFKTQEINGYYDDSPKELNLLFSYEKEDTFSTEEAAALAQFDYRFSDAIGSFGIEYLIESIDTVQHQMKHVEEQEAYKRAISYNIQKFSGGNYADGFGLYYEVEILDTIDYTVKVDYAIQFRTVFQDEKPEYRVPLKNGEASLKAIRRNLVKALEEVKKYEPTE